MGWNPARSVRARLIAAFLALGLVPLLLVSVVAYRSAESSLIESAGQRLEDVAFNAVDKLDRNLFERYGDVQAYALSDPARSMDPEQVTTWIDTMMGVYTPIYKLMVVADRQGKIIAVNSVDLDGKPLPKTSQLLERNVSNDTWFKEAISGKIKDGASFVEDLHHDPLMAVVYGTTSGADFAMSYTAPIKNANGEIVGVWTNRFNWDVATQILDENAARAHASGMTTVELGLASPKGEILASPNAASVLNGSYTGRTGVADPNAAAVGHTAGTTLGGEAGFEGWAQSVGYMTYPGVKWTLVASQSRAEVLAPVRDLGLLMLLTGLVAAMAIVGGAWLVARPIEHSVLQVSAAAHGLARGDLDQQVDVRSQDELGQMATAVREMIAYQQQVAQVAGKVAEGDLRVTVTPVSDRDVLGQAVSRMVARLGDLLSETRASADGLADTSTMMENVTGEVALTVGQVSLSVRQAADNAREQSASMSAASRSVDELLTAIEQVARGAQEQAQDLTSASAQAEEMARGVERVASVAERVSESSRASHETAERGVFAVRDAVAGMGEIEHVVEVASARVIGLGALGDRIGSVVDTINEIAQQTNLLALNASIEAARAGEHGRGFAVVAGEVRKLAERSQRETHAIEELIREVREGTEEAVRAMEAGVDQVRTGARKADEAGQALAEILAAVETTVGEVDEIAAASSTMMKGGRDVSDALVRLSAAVEQSSATAEEMSATADEVGRSVQGMASVVEISTRDLESVAESAEQMHAQMSSIESRADRLAATAAGLKALVTRFQLADSPTQQVADRPVDAPTAETKGRLGRPVSERLAS